MPTIDVLERAAGSLGFANEREGPWLKIEVSAGVALRFAPVDGKPETTVRYGTPGWFQKLCFVVVSTTAAIYLVRAPLAGGTVLFSLFFLLSAWGYASLDSKVERAQERLLDRAYDMGKAA
jgi:hypothetical protein